MTPHYEDDDVTLYAGDCIEVMRGLPDAACAAFEAFDRVGGFVLTIAADLAHPENDHALLFRRHVEEES